MADLTSVPPASSLATTIDPTPAVKPGYRTTEFWLALAAKLLGVLFATGVLADGSTAARIAGLAATVLAAYGYSVSRGLAKGSAPSSTAVTVSGPRGFASLRLLVVLAGTALAVLTFGSGCGARMKTAETVAYDCAKADVAAAVPQLLPTVEGILAAPSTMATALVDALLKIVAPDVLACTVQAAKAAFATAKVGDPIGTQANTSALANADQAIAAHGWVFKQ